jgi:ArsR family transcriptional regulator, arsenate/arsenite/antimonite-responsive transcriptional repressor
MKRIATITPISCCAPGSPPLKGNQLAALAGQFKALSDPTRLSIVNSLANREECCVCEFQHLGLSQPTISHHLKILREAGLVDVARKRGTWTYYRLVPAVVESLAFALGGAAKPETVLAAAAGSVAR